MTEEQRIILSGSEKYWDWYEWGEQLDAAFPGQDADQLGSAIEHNGSGPIVEGVGVTGLFMVHRGEHDEEDWVWLVRLDDGSHWLAVGGCDYTGWDCQSYLDWMPFEP